MNVVGTSVKDWIKDDGTVVKVCTVKFDDGSEAPGYDLPSLLEIGKPLPAGWEIATSKAGKPYIKVPKAGKGGFGGGAAAHRNTKEGQAYEQERMDRRTALMQAVALPSPTGQPLPSDAVEFIADQFYAWLRQTAGDAGKASPVVGGGPGDGEAPAPSPTPSSPAADSMGVLPAAGDHQHAWKPSPREHMAAKGWEVCDCGETRKS